MTPTALILTAVAVVFVIGLVAVIVERTEERDAAKVLAAKAVAEAEWFRDAAEKLADEQKATHAANEILCAELACSDEIIRALQNDRLATDLAAYDAAVTAPVPFVPTDGPHLRVVPEQRDGAHDSLAALDAEATAYTWPAIARDAFPVREWGEEAEK